MRVAVTADNSCMFNLMLFCFQRNLMCNITLYITTTFTPHPACKHKSCLLLHCRWLMSMHWSGTKYCLRELNVKFPPCFLSWPRMLLNELVCRKSLAIGDKPHDRRIRAIGLCSGIWLTLPLKSRPDMCYDADSGCSRSKRVAIK